MAALSAPVRPGAESGAARPAAPEGCVWAEIDLAAIRHNVRAVRSVLPRSARMIAVAKADGYGHGALRVADAALAAGAWGIGVARVPEGVELRRAGIGAPILVFGYAAEGELPRAVEHGLTVTVSGWRTALGLAALGAAAERRARAHLKVDTGMRRYGVPLEDAARFTEAAATLPGLELEGLYTHFATADEPDIVAFERQTREFDALVRGLDASGLRPAIVHAANSAAISRGPETAYDAVRPGIALYGVQPSAASRLDLRPAMALKARVGRVLDVPAGDGVSYGHDYRAEAGHRAAVVTCGYADGYMRSLGGRGEVLIGGRRCRVLGRVCMDSVVVGLPDGLETAEGAEAALLGAQGPERVRAEELAERAGTLAYELLCGMGGRPERVYSG